MLSRFGLGKASTTLDTLLDNRRVTLPEVLAVEDCLLQVQLRHKKLIDFMRQPLVISQLIRFLVIDDAAHAWVACEILASSIPALMDALLSQHHELLTVYWTLLYQDYQLTRAQVAYFVKINTVLLTRRPADMVRFVARLTDVLPHWINHIHDPHGALLADLLLSLIECELAPEATGIAKWLRDQGLTELLLQQLQPDKDVMHHQTAEQLFAGILRLGQTSHQELQSMGHNDLVHAFASEQTMHQLMDMMLDTKAPEAVDSFLVGARLLIHFVRYNDDRQQEQAPPRPQQAENSLSQRTKILIPMIQCATTKMHAFLDLLEQPRSQNKTRFGMERLVLLDLLSEWLHCANLAGIDEYGLELKAMYHSHRIIPRILDLFFAHPSCNLAHSVICDMVGQIFECQRLDQLANRNLLFSVFVDAELIQRILEAYEHDDDEAWQGANDHDSDDSSSFASKDGDNGAINADFKDSIPNDPVNGASNGIHESPAESRKMASRRPGYMGHLVLMTRAILTLFGQQPRLEEALRDKLPWAAWQKLSLSLMDTYKSWEHPLVPMPSASDLKEPKRQPSPNPPPPASMQPPTSTPNGFPLPPPPIYLSPSSSLEIRMTAR
ncbi:SIT4 phosphatase-associated protein-domain-containing protein [Gongronella butleri]|nr:SIT4 phosphatase-associated protein-domain-containing protein [Gongronella butleri]